MRMLLETTMPVIMMTPISDMMLSVLPVSSRMMATPSRPGRNGHEDDEWIDEGGELRHEDEVDEEDGDDEADAEVVKGLFHPDDGAAHVDDGVAVVLGVGKQVIDALAYRLQGLCPRSNIDVDDAADLVVIDFGGRIDLVDSATEPRVTTPSMLSPMGSAA